MIKLFTATWCTPCNNLKDSLQPGDLDGVVLIDVDEQADEVAKHDIRSVPTVVKIYGGIEDGRITGTMSRSKFLDFINE